MRNHNTLGALEDAHHEAVVTAKRRIENAEEYVASYRSQMNRMQETFHELATQEGLADDAGFRLELQQISDEAEDEVRRATQAIIRLEDDLSAMTIRHAHERERFLQGRHETADRSLK
jgi:hypothetical protein